MAGYDIHVIIPGDIDEYLNNWTDFQAGLYASILRATVDSSGMAAVYTSNKQYGILLLTPNSPEIRENVTRFLAQENAKTYTNNHPDESKS